MHFLFVVCVCDIISFPPTCIPLKKELAIENNCAIPCGLD